MQYKWSRRSVFEFHKIAVKDSKIPFLPSFGKVLSFPALYRMFDSLTRLPLWFYAYILYIVLTVYLCDKMKCFSLCIEGLLWKYMRKLYTSYGEKYILDELLFFQKLWQITQLFTGIFPVVYIVSRYFRTGYEID